MYKKKPKNQHPYSNAGEAIGKMLVERRISTKINYDVLRDIEIDVKGETSNSKLEVPAADVDMETVVDEKITGELQH